MVSTVASQQEGPGFDTWLGWDLSVCGLHVCVGSPPPGTLAFYHSLKTRRLTGDSKLPVDVIVSGCLSLYVCPGINWLLVLAEPRPRPMSAGIFTSLPTTLQSISSHG